MVEINTADDLATFLSEIATSNATARHTNVWVSFSIDTAGRGIRCTGFKNGRSVDQHVDWIDLIMSNGASVHAAVTRINQELATGG